MRSARGRTSDRNPRPAASTEPSDGTSQLLTAGVDLSGRSKGTTAIAWLEGRRDGSPHIRATECEGLRGDRGDAKLVREVLSKRPATVAIDAPLHLPHAVQCDKDDCEQCFPADGSIPSYTTRAADEASNWRTVGHDNKTPMPTAMIAAIAFRGIFIRRALERESVTVVETWPMGVYRALERRRKAIATGATDADWRRTILASAVSGVPDDLQGLDVLDAVAASYAAWCVAIGSAVPVPPETADSDEGAIWIPRGV